MIFCGRPLRHPHTDVAWKIQERCKHAVESMTGLEVTRINVHVRVSALIQARRKTAKRSCVYVNEKSPCTCRASPIPDLTAQGVGIAVKARERLLLILLAVIVGRWPLLREVPP